MARAKAEGRKQPPDTNKNPVWSVAGGNGSWQKPAELQRRIRACPSSSVQAHPVLLLQPLWHACDLEFMSWMDRTLSGNLGWTSVPDLGGKINLHNGKSTCNLLLAAAFWDFESSWRNLPQSWEPFHAFQNLTRHLLLLYQTQTGAALNWARPVSLAAMQTCISTKQKYLKTQELENGGVEPSTQAHFQLATNLKLSSGSANCFNTESQNFRGPSLKSFATEAWIFLSQDGINKCWGELFFN